MNTFMKLRLALNRPLYGRFTGWMALAGAAVLGLAVTAAVVARHRLRPADDGDGTAVYTVRRGPLTISVIESGTIKAKEQEIIKSEVEGQAQIIFLIPEGTRVKKGDLLVELDKSQIQDQLTDQQIKVQNADAAFVRARESLAVAKNQAESDEAKANLDYIFAQEDITKYEDGEYPAELKKAESEITLKREELERAAQKLEWSEKLFAEKYIAQTELESDRLAKHRAELEAELAQGALSLLKEYTYKRKKAQLASDLSQARLALERVKRKAMADVVQAEAELKAKEAELTRQKEKLDKLETQIKKTKMYAPVEAMAVYATSAQGGGWRSNEPLAEGQMVRERQELIYLPTADSMVAEVKIHESNLEKIKLDQPVRVTVDALPGRLYNGSVTKIAPLPDAQSMWMNPDLKVFSLQITIDANESQMSTGMTCQAEIMVEQHAEAVYVPVQAVVRIGNQPTVYVRQRGASVQRQVKVGLDNNRVIHVLEGLKPGEEVLLAPPLAPAMKPAEEEKRFTVPPKRPAAAPHGPNAGSVAPPAGRATPAAPVAAPTPVAAAQAGNPEGSRSRVSDGSSGKSGDRGGAVPRSGRPPGEPSRRAGGTP